MIQNFEIVLPPDGADGISGMPELLGSNAEECLRLARETRDRVIRDELLRLAAAYRDRARALEMRTAG